MVMINLHVARKLLDMCVLMLQKKMEKEKKKEKLITILRKSQFSEFPFN